MGAPTMRVTPFLLQLAALAVCTVALSQGHMEVEAQLLQHPANVGSPDKVHTMPDGSTMLDTDMAAWEMKHSPGMHMMKDGSWMKDSKMTHRMPDGKMMRDIDMPSHQGEGLLAASEDLHRKYLRKSKQWKKFLKKRK